MLLLVIPLSPAATAATTAADDTGNTLSPGVIDLRVYFVVRIVSPVQYYPTFIKIGFEFLWRPTPKAMDLFGVGIWILAEGTDHRRSGIILLEPVIIRSSRNRN